VDVYDALTSERSYKAAYSHEETVKIIQDGAGSHFDPDIVDCFMEVKQHFKLILRKAIEVPMLGNIQQYRKYCLCRNIVVML